jgi:hypothetical protein
MQFKGLLFAGIAFVICLIFAVLGGYWLYDNNDKIDKNQQIVDDFEKEDGKYHSDYEFDQNNTDYLEAKSNLDDANSNKSFSYVFFTISVICLLVAIALVAIHFIMERNADKKLGDSFFVDGKPPPTR